MSIWDDTRADPAVPVALSPLAAQDGGPDSDGPGVDFSFFVSLGASLDTLSSGLQDDRDRRASMRPPGDQLIARAGVAPASGTLLLDLGGSVPIGRVWQIRRLIIGGVAVTTAAEGAAYAFAQGAPPTDLILTDCVGMYPTLPAIEKFGTHQLFMLEGERLWVAFVGATSGQQYAAAARVEDWDASNFRSTFTE